MVNIDQNITIGIKILVEIRSRNMTTKIEVERFNGTSDFGICKRRMYAILVPQKVAKALGGLKCLLESHTDEEKYEKMKIACSTLTLHFDDNVIWKVSSESTAAGLWKKLEALYMTRSLQDIIYLKSIFFAYKMVYSKSNRESR